MSVNYPSDDSIVVSDDSTQFEIENPALISGSHKSALEQLFAHHTVASQICRDALELYRTPASLRSATKDEDRQFPEHLAFASTCSLIHRHMVRHLFRKVKFRAKENGLELLGQWHPDTLRSIR